MKESRFLSRRRLLELSTGLIVSAAGCGRQSDKGSRSATERSASTSTRTADKSGTPTDEPKTNTSEPETTTPLDVQITSKVVGPPGGPVTGLDASSAAPEQVYIATPTAGVYYSSNGGSFWSQGPGYLHHSRRIYASPSDPNIAYTPGSWTTNGGASWEDNNIPEDAVRDIEFDRIDQEVHYAGTKQGLARSMDGGKTWTSTTISIDGQQRDVWSVSTSPTSKGSVTAAVSPMGILRSEDHGKSWTAVSGMSSLPDNLPFDLEVDPADPETAYVAINGHGIYRVGSGDPTEITESLPSLVFPKDCMSFATEGKVLYFVASPNRGDESGAKKLYRADVTTGKITKITTPSEPYSISATATASGTLLLGGKMAPYVSTDGGSTWTERSTGFVDRHLAAVGVNHSNPDIVLTGTECSGGLFVSRDAGNSWAWKRSGISPYHEGDEWGEHYVMHVHAHGNWAYATTASGLLISRDGGQTWEMLDSEFSGDRWTHLHGLGLHPADPQTVYVGTGRGNAGTEEDAFSGAALWKSTNGGTSWQKVTSGFPTHADTTIQSILVNPHNPQTVYVGTNENDYIHGGKSGGTSVGLWKSTNAGASWQSVDAPFTNINDLAVVSGQAESIIAATNQGVYRSDDGGAHWQSMTLTPKLALETHPDVPDLLFAAKKWLSMSVDGGQSWQNLELREDITDFGKREDIRSIALDHQNKLLYAASLGAGLWQVDISDILDSIGDS